LYDSSIATGASARTLEVNSVASLSTPSIRKRSRSRIEHSEGLVIKKKKEQEEDPLITALNRSIESRVSTQKSNIMKAIELLAKEYETRLSEVDFGAATDLLSDEVKASVFITLPKTDMRDRFLERHANVFFKDLLLE
jgi:hypothetical protein